MNKIAILTFAASVSAINLQAGATFADPVHGWEDSTEYVDSDNVVKFGNTLDEAFTNTNEKMMDSIDNIHDAKWTALDAV